LVWDLVYKDLSEILLRKLVKIYQEIAYISPNEKLGQIAQDKIQVIAHYLAPKLNNKLNSESSLQ
jgi:hypothetical protein